MGARDVLETLAAAGVTIRLDGDRLIASPRESLTDDLRASLKANKAALMAALQGGAAAPTEESPPVGKAPSEAALYNAAQQLYERPEPPEDWPDAAVPDVELEPLRARPAVWRRLIAMGLDEDRADDLAEWMDVRDIQGDDRRVCIECRHFAQRGKTCRHPHLVVIQSPRDLGALATTPQRCMCFVQGGADGH